LSHNPRANLNFFKEDSFISYITIKYSKRQKTPGARKDKGIVPMLLAELVGPKILPPAVWKSPGLALKVPEGPGPERSYFLLPGSAFGRMAPFLPGPLTWARA
jgi:hypothetical protein